MPPPGLSFPVYNRRGLAGPERPLPSPPTPPNPTDLLLLPSQSPASGPPSRSATSKGGPEAWGAREAFRPLSPPPPASLSHPRPTRPGTQLRAPAAPPTAPRPPLPAEAPEPGPGQRARSPVRSKHTHHPDLSFLPPHTRRQPGGGERGQGWAGGAGVEASRPLPPSRVRGRPPNSLT